MSAYLDTHVAVWLAYGETANLTPAAKQAMTATNLLISPMVLLEMEYLFELKKKIGLSAEDMQRKLEAEVGVRVCGLSFPAIARVALHEKWTGDPFDRLIVAHAKANVLSVLISADRLIRQNYIRAVW